MLEHKKIAFENILSWTIQSTENWKKCSLVLMTYFVFWVFTISILFRSYSIIHDEEPIVTDKESSDDFSDVESEN